MKNLMMSLLGSLIVLTSTVYAADVDCGSYAVDYAKSTVGATCATSECTINQIGGDEFIITVCQGTNEQQQVDIVTNSNYSCAYVKATVIPHSN
jgi:hypothetical protein